MLWNTIFLENESLVGPYAPSIQSLVQHIVSINKHYGKGNISSFIYDDVEHRGWITTHLQYGKQHLQFTFDGTTLRFRGKQRSIKKSTEAYL